MAENSFMDKFMVFYEKHPKTARLSIIMGAATIVGIAVTVFSYGIRYTSTHSWNWNEQTKIINEQNIEYNDKQMQFNQLYATFLEYADVDKKGGISFAEQADAWEKLGYKGPFFESKERDIYSQFPRVTIKDIPRLEKAIQIYENELDSSNLK